MPATTPRCTHGPSGVAELLRQHNASWLNLWNAIAAYYYALLGKTDKIPEVFRAHRLSTVHTLAPGKPMIEMIENQVGLAQGDYARVVGRSERLLAVCEGMHYALVAMHIRIQTAAAYEMLGKHAEAQAQLDQALTDAEPDGFVIPFAENYRYLKPLLAERLQTGMVAQIIELGEAAERRKAGFDRPEALSALTEREYEIVRLIGTAAEQPRDRGKAVSVRGQYPAVCESNLHQTADSRRAARKAQAAARPACG